MSTQDKLTPDEIWYMDAGIFTMNDDNLRGIMSRVYAKIPAEAVEKVMDECLMIIPLAIEEGCYLPKKLIEGKNLILLPEALLNEDWSRIEYVILHETAHFILGHTSPFLVDDLDYDAQEREANELVQRWLSGAMNE